jgi:hypothetical protein
MNPNELIPVECSNGSDATNIVFKRAEELYCECGLVSWDGCCPVHDTEENPDD